MISEKQMKKVGFQLKAGKIESHSSSSPIGWATVFHTVTFEDGTVWNNVMVDKQLEAYVSPGLTGKFATAQIRGFRYMLAVEFGDGKLRTANGISYRLGHHVTMFFVFLFLLCFTMGLGLVWWPLSILILVPFIGAYFRFDEGRRLALARRAIRVIADTRKLALDAADDRFGGSASAAAPA